jgi:tetratricopeptide (TPR) repeat protein
MDNLDQAFKLLQSGQIDQARIYLEELLRQDPENPDLLYNLGLCYVDLGQLDRGMEMLQRCLMRLPEHSHACVALGIACQKKGDLSGAKEYAMRAVQADSRNPVARLPELLAQLLSHLCIIYSIGSPSSSCAWRAHVAPGREHVAAFPDFFG